MSKFQSLLFEPWHLDACDLREHEEQVINKDEIIALGTLAPAQTMIVDGEIVCIFGYYHINPKVINVYVLPTTALPKYALTVCRRIKMYMDRLEQDLGVHRIQSAARDDAATSRWMQFFGFQLEGRMRKFTQDGTDYCMWGKVL